jgi:2-dehydro-3-deoxyphosphogluconate aldolase/(4S)-4-hydroxy-2-oxoglutarate aldolase
VTLAVLEQLRRLRIVPLVVMDDPDRAVPLARALVEGGLPCAEIAFRTRGAAEVLHRIAAEDSDMLVGAGTVLTREQAQQARRAGARFIVSPGLQPRVVDFCREHNLPVIPGVATPTEVGAALELGLHVLKLFPAEPLGGLPYLQAIAAPFPDVEFVPTGGITADNLAAYLALPCVAACGGSWMAPRAWIEAGDFDRISRSVEHAVLLAHPAAAEG